MDDQQRITIDDIRKVKMVRSAESFTGWMMYVNDSTDGIPATIFCVAMYRLYKQQQQKVRELQAIIKSKEAYAEIPKI